MPPPGFPRGLGNRNDTVLIADGIFLSRDGCVNKNASHQRLGPQASCRNTILIVDTVPEGT